jgi:hypothetical protein
MRDPKALAEPLEGGASLSRQLAAAGSRVSEPTKETQPAPVPTEVIPAALSTVWSLARLASSGSLAYTRWGC